ncbi:MAG TPA: hypothetical protein PLB10_11070 [Thiolinea sp.]|nr:hypothetical protein [Thiolinea sp.]
MAAAVFCHAFQVDFSLIHGRVVVRDGQLLTTELQETLRRHRAISRAMLAG